GGLEATLGRLEYVALVTVRSGCGSRMATLCGWRTFKAVLLPVAIANRPRVSHIFLANAEKSGHFAGRPKYQRYSVLLGINRSSTCALGVHNSRANVRPCRDGHGDSATIDVDTRQTSRERDFAAKNLGDATGMTTLAREAPGHTPDHEQKRVALG